MHIGHRIEEVFRAKGCKPVWFAAQLNMVRANIYDIFKRPGIDSELLLRISLILKHDFFADLSNDYRMTLQAKDTPEQAE